jgi:hypothetical protein
MRGVFCVQAVQGPATGETCRNHEGQDRTGGETHNGVRVAAGQDHECVKADSNLYGLMEVVVRYRIAAQPVLVAVHLVYAAAKLPRNEGQSPITTSAK